MPHTVPTSPTTNPSTSARGALKLLAKATLGGVLIFYVLRSNMVNFQSLTAFLFNPLSVILALLFLGFSALCCAVRWHRLVKVQGLALSLKDVIELTMIGFFFNSFMPGSVGGDLIKAWYAAGQEPRRKTRAVFTVLLDRVIGLGVIVAFAGGTLVFHLSWLEGRAELRLLAAALWAFMGASVVFALLFFASGAHEPRPVTRLWAWVRRSKRLGTLLDSALVYRHHLVPVLVAVLLSSLSILATIVLYTLQGNEMGIELTPSQYFFVIPVALTASAIPLLPGGIGVGQVAFYKLFQWVGAAHPAQGGTLCTLLQIYTLLFNCTGAIFYLKFKRKPAEAGVEKTAVTPENTAAGALSSAIPIPSPGL